MATFTRPVTREEKEKSKQEFEDLLYLLHQELRDIEGWLLNTANKKLNEIDKLLKGDLKNAEKRWECEAELRIVKTYIKTGQSKVDFVATLIDRLNEQVLHAPHKVKDSDDDTSESRLYKAREAKNAYEDKREAWDRWVSWCMRSQEAFKKLTKIKIPKPEDNEAEEDRDRRRPRYEDKGSTNDAKGLKPDVLETSMPQLTIKNWFTCWDNYMHASGWGNTENHKTQMAYLRICLSE